MTPFTIAGIQMQVDALGENLTMMQQKVNVAMANFPWINMIVFSELAPFGPLHHNHPASNDQALEIFTNLAKKHHIWLIPGSIFETREEKVYNTSFVINPDGEIVGQYDKLFPFMPYEHDVTGGDKFLVWDVPNVGRFGLSICYDMWFPETVRTLTAMGAEVIIHPVLTGTTDREIELSIARATAAQFQCFVVDINGLKAGGAGQSIIVAPGGQVMYQSRTREDTFPIEIDFDQVRHQRERGKNGLGQLLKSFRDRNVEFPVYRSDIFDHHYYDSLGKLTMSTQRQYSDFQGPLQYPRPDQVTHTHKAPSNPANDPAQALLSNTPPADPPTIIPETNYTSAGNTPAPHRQ